MKEGSIFYEGVYFIAHNSAFAALALLTACILCHLPSVYGTFIYHINRPCQLSDKLTVILNV